MTAVREAWTDERLDDLTKHMDENFREVRADLRLLRGELTGGLEEGRGELKAGLDSVRGEIKAGLDSVRAEIREVRAEVAVVREEIAELRGEMRTGFAALNRTLQISAALIGAMFVGLMGMIGTQL